MEENWQETSKGGLEFVKSVEIENGGDGSGNEKDQGGSGVRKFDEIFNNFLLNQPTEFFLQKLACISFYLQIVQSLLRLL